MLTSSTGIKSYLKDSKGFLFKKLNIDGIEVVAVDVHYSQKMGTLRRIWVFLLFLILSSVYMLFCKKPDVVYATSTPLTVGIAAIVGKAIRKVPYVFEVRDQWPQVPVDLGIIRNSLVKRILRWLERTIYIHSRAVVALSPGMEKGIKGVLLDIQKPIHVIPNCSDVDRYDLEMDCSDLRRKYAWEGKVVFIHAGAMGKVNGLDFLINAAERVKGYPSIHIVILGRGRERDHLQEMTRSKGLQNVEFLDFVPKAELPLYLLACDVSTVIIGDYPILEHNSANKFFDSLAAGKPVLINYSGWQRDELESYNAGFGCKLCDVDEFVEKVLFLSSHEDEMSK